MNHLLASAHCDLPAVPWPCKGPERRCPPAPQTPADSGPSAEPLALDRVISLGLGEGLFPPAGSDF